MTLLHLALYGVEKQLNNPVEEALRNFTSALHSEQQKINISFYIEIMLELNVKCPQYFFVCEEKEIQILSGRNVFLGL